MELTNISNYKEKLLASKKNLEKEISRIADPTGTPGEYTTRYNDDSRYHEDNANETEEFVDNIAVEAALEKQLRDVLSALERINTGTYGICTKCSGQIPLARLDAYSAAATCVTCS